MISKLLDWLVDHHYVVLLFGLVVTVLAIDQAVDLENRRIRISVDSSIENLLPASGEALQVYTKVRDKFVGDDMLIVVWLSDDLFTPQRLASLKRLTRRLKKMPGIVAVDSLASAPYVRAEEDFTEIGPFLQNLPDNAEEARSLKADALANPLYTGTLISRDGRGAIVAVHFDPTLDTAAVGNKVDAVALASAEEAGDIQHFVTGPIVARLVHIARSNRAPAQMPQSRLAFGIEFQGAGQACRHLGRYITARLLHQDFGDRQFDRWIAGGQRCSLAQGEEFILGLVQHIVGIVPRPGCSTHKPNQYKGEWQSMRAVRASGYSPRAK